MGILAWFFTSAIGRIVGLALLGAALFGGGYVTGGLTSWIAAREAAKVATLQSELAAAKADSDIDAILHSVVQGQLDALQEEHSGLARQVSDYEQDVSKLTSENRVCRAASADDIRRLRAIR